jgi:hypothetical protein
MLVYRGCSWLVATPGANWLQLAGSGVSSGLLIHHFGFLKIVNRNMARINQLGDKAPVTSFIPLKSYLTIAVMATAGVLLRHSDLPKQYLTVLYCAIGSALILSSVRYLRACIMWLSRNKVTRV